MKLKDIVDSIQRNVEGGTANTASRFSPKALKKMINTYRATIIERNYYKNDFINPLCYQRYYLLYRSDLQAYAPEGALLFALPSVIQLGDEDGIRYAGSKDCNSQWKRLLNRGQLATLNAHPITALKNNPDKIFYLFIEGNLEIYNANGLQEGWVEGIFANPLEIPTYNEDTDDYPMAVDDIAELESLIYAQRTAVAKMTEPQTEFNTPDFKESAPPRNEKL